MNKIFKVLRAHFISPSKCYRKLKPYNLEGLGVDPKHSATRYRANLNADILCCHMVRDKITKKNLKI